MNTTGWIIYGMSHSAQVMMQACQLIGAYRDHLPANAETRTLILNTLEALSNVRLAHFTDWEEHNAPLIEKQMDEAMTQLEKASRAVARFRAAGGDI